MHIGIPQSPVAAKGFGGFGTWTDPGSSATFETIVPFRRPGFTECERRALCFHAAGLPNRPGGFSLGNEFEHRIRKAIAYDIYQPITAFVSRRSGIQT
jgi:hypothetical protein